MVYLDHALIFVMNRECMDFHYNRMKETLNKKCKVTRLTNEVLPHHSKDMPLYSFDTLNGKLAFPIPGNLGANNFRHCPEMVVHDIIRMWSEVNENLPGISLTTPMFADGYINFNPRLIGLKFLLFDQSFSLTRLRDDWLNQCYSSFVYLPDRFRNLSGVNQWTFSTDVDCLNYYVTQETAKGEEKTSTNYLQAHCIPLPNRYKPLCSSDGLFAKVPCSNASMRSSLMACNTFRCLTMFRYMLLKKNNDDSKTHHQITTYIYPH